MRVRGQGMADVGVGGLLPKTGSNLSRRAASWAARWSGSSWRGTGRGRGIGLVVVVVYVAVEDVVMRVPGMLMIWSSILREIEPAWRWKRKP